MKTLSNADVAEFLAREAEAHEGIRRRAFRRAARNAFLWPEQARDILEAGRSLTELKGVGPFIARRLLEWLQNPSPKVIPPPLRRDFITLADAYSLLAAKPFWSKQLRGDLQMHTRWSDGSASIAEMAAAAAQRGYEYIAITDHSKGLKIAGGIDEAALEKQATEILQVNQTTYAAGGTLTVLRSIEMNLNPHGQGDMDAKALRRLDVVLGSFHSSLRTTEDQTERYNAALRNREVHILGILADASITIGVDLRPIGPVSLRKQHDSIKQSRSIAIPTGRI